MFTWIIIILVQIYFENYIARKCLLVAHVDLIRRICQKQSQKLNLKKWGVCSQEGWTIALFQMEGKEGRDNAKYNPRSYSC